MNTAVFSRTFSSLLCSKSRSLAVCSAFSRSQRGFATSKAVYKSAIVTGAGQGLGKAIALRLARDGFDICINDLKGNSNKVEDVVNEIKNLGRKAIPAYGDVSKLSQIEAVVEASVDSLGPLHVMVANAGIEQVKWGLEVQETDLQRVFDVNFYGVVYSNQVAARQFIKQGSGGKIINAASLVSFRPLPMGSVYAASKAAVRSLTQSLAMELGKDNITVNAYAPGHIGTSMWERIDGDLSAINGLPKGEIFDSVKSTITLGRTGVPEDVSKLVSFLASEDSNYVTGQTMLVDGGIFFS